jgi:hypothetical protein
MAQNNETILEKISITLNNINTKLDEGVGIQAIKQQTGGRLSLTNITADPNAPNNKDRLNVTTEFGGDFKTTSDKANVLISGKNNITNIPVAVNSSGQIIIAPLDKIGSHNNIKAGTLAPNTDSTPLNVTLYRISVLSYSDTSYTLNNTLHLLGSIDNITYDFIGMLIPITDNTTNKRYGTTTLELSPFNYFKISNKSGQNITGIECSLYGSTEVNNLLVKGTSKKIINKQSTNKPIVNKLINKKNK